ncbi:TetR/AcrR family transcriptional regulator [Lentilactobacillus sp. Marseille-Q4993]|uniref:TetR/AcrR family transcriptional regulator n=1 Tax=Lentilactobacillus sp. Marseille-Q4993 TaxID=3039492 RepID=UPI0024BCFCDF|nr:TetR/AcrR family transcriptional regulator [Lentilactobacillus sp. Marseille-Q4993]
MSSTRRETQSRAQITDAFWIVLANKGFVKLKVKDVIDEAGLNRTTFYTYFDDKFDLLGQCQNGLIDGIKDVFDKVKNYRRGIAD